MSAGTHRVCVYASPGRGLGEALVLVRKAFPSAYLIAVVSPGYQPAPPEQASADEWVTTELAHYSLRNLAAAHRLLGQIRALRAETFVVLFHSRRLGLLAALSRVPNPSYCAIDGQLHPLPRSATKVVLGGLVQAVGGRLRYAVIRTAIHTSAVRDSGVDRSGGGNT